ncbi:MAG: PIN domain-containing protein [Limnochordaceae bacterium]|nr:PIN domain-containing protein [Limnochordaceae bacterium]
MAMLTELPAGASVYIDANIFVYHFTGMSQQVRTFLSRCERHEVAANAGTLVLLEVLHRLMVIEARHKGLVSGANPVRQLEQHPDRVRALSEYQFHTQAIPAMGVHILDLPGDWLTRSLELRQRYGLLTTDSVIALEMLDHGIPFIASADPAFDRVPGVTRLAPTDLPFQA